MTDELYFMEKALEKAVEYGADFAEVRFEEENILYIRFEKEDIKSLDVGSDVGLGIVVYYKGARGYSYTSELTEVSVDEMVKNAIRVAKASSLLTKEKIEPIEYKPEDYKGFVPSVKKHPRDVSLEEKIEIARLGIKHALSKEGIASLVTYYGERWGRKIFLNSEGLKRSWNPIIVGLIYLAVARKNGNVGRSYENFSASRGLELFEDRSPEEIVERAVKGAFDNLEGKIIKSGEYPIVADPEFAGLIAHESFGHLTEGDYVATKASILYGRLGEKLGSDEANILESGDPVNYGYWVPYDDEGVATKTVYLVKNGYLEGYLHSRFTAKMMNMSPTGNARAINYRFPPIVRMRNTYFGPGDMTKEEVFEVIKRGVYAEGSMGGQTNDIGVFTFGANRAYWIEDGEIKYPIKSVTVRGNILDFLKNIIGASKEVYVRTSIRGGCGKAMQGPLPVGLGGPYLAVKKAIISVGG